LFGWYNVQEYGTNNSNTFEIALFDNGNIQLNYGAMSASGGRDFTAGITGPEAGDNVQLFYGRDPQFLQNQSGLLTYGAPIPDEVAIDCNATPQHPSCPPVSVAVDVGAPDPTESALEAAVASVEQAAMEETQEEVLIEDIAEIEQVLETAQEALETANASVEEAVEAAVEAAVERAAVAEKAEAELKALKSQVPKQEEKQKLVNLMFQMVLVTTNDPVFCKRPRGERMAWVANNLRDMGIDTHPIGMSWGVIINNEFRETTEIIKDNLELIGSMYNLSSELIKKRIMKLNKLIDIENFMT
jgi:hypothetical protein